MTKENKFIEAPWFMEKCDFGNGDKEETSWIINDKGESVIDYKGCGSHEVEYANEATKRLILAAPILYEGLLESTKFLRKLVKEGALHKDTLEPIVILEKIINDINGE